MYKFVKVVLLFEVLIVLIWTILLFSNPPRVIAPDYTLAPTQPMPLNNGLYYDCILAIRSK